MHNVLTVKNQTDSSADLYIYGDIINNTAWKCDDSDIMPDDVKHILGQLEDKSNLNIYVNSGGGSVFAGLAIYNMLKRNQAQKTVYVDGVAASIASVIALAGDRVVVPSNAFLMIHKPWTISAGNANDFRKMAEDLDHIESGILNVYKENLKDGIGIEEIQQLVDAETWLSGEEAEKYFHIEVVEAKEVAACTSNYFEKYQKTPEKLGFKSKQSVQKDDVEQLKIQNALDLLEL
ncbi:head maturation protease, ClpP-related [Bacillus wiedmannii]|uniref:head maturation protease, ClpP-related n=1 Tax=Bacillus wiedmannii TaxID=1890302 RepID=UPI001D5B611B|nr:head maturation protease, ClpP-related [Bacillus wiedmannii]MBG9830467.1 peptidase [Bacillus wiedmannii]UOB94164.1 Clp protease [Bacillus wiedmannii]